MLFLNCYNTLIDSKRPLQPGEILPLRLNNNFIELCYLKISIYLQHY